MIFENIKIVGVAFAPVADERIDCIHTVFEYFRLSVTPRVNIIVSSHSSSGMENIRISMINSDGSWVFAPL